MRQGFRSLCFWKKTLEMTKARETHHTRTTGSSRGGTRQNSYFHPAPFLAFGIVIGKCDSGVGNTSCESSEKCPPSPHIPKSPKDEFNSIKYISSSPASCPKNCSPPGSSLLMGVGQEDRKMKNDPEELTHHFLLKQAATVMTDSVTRLLTQTVSALEDYHEQYREMIDALTGLLEESRVASPVNQELANCKMIVLRSQMEDMKKNIHEIELFWSSVEVLVSQTAQTSYLARAEYPSTALCERLHSAMVQVGRIKGVTNEMESDLVQLQAVIIVESGKSLK